MNNPDRVPLSVWFFSRTAVALLRVGVPRRHCEKFVAGSCFWTRQAGWAVRQPAEMWRGVSASYQPSKARHLTAGSSVMRWLLFHLAFTLGALQTACELPRDVWSRVCEDRRDCLAQFAQQRSQADE